LYCNDTVWVFKPEGYDTTGKYPAVYMLHGWTGTYKSWNKLVNLQDIATSYNFIIICPDGLFNSYYFNSPLIKNSQFESFFFTELMPDINESYAIDTAKVFITGLSMGGGGAMYLFLRHPDLFLSAGSTSGLMDLSYSSTRNERLSELLGSYSSHTEVFANYSASIILKI